MPLAITAVAAFLAPVAGVAGANFLATVFVYAASTYLLNRAAEALAPSRSSSGLGGGAVENLYDREYP